MSGEQEGMVYGKCTEKNDLICRPNLKQTSSNSLDHPPFILSLR